jgi:hypothetical protein
MRLYQNPFYEESHIKICCRYSDKTRISHFHENRVNNIFIFYHGKTTHRPEKSVENLRKIKVFHENLFFIMKKVQLL